MLFFLGYKKSRRDENGSRSIQKNKREVEQGLEVKSDEKKKITTAWLCEIRGYVYHYP